MLVLWTNLAFTRVSLQGQQFKTKDIHLYVWCEAWIQTQVNMISNARYQQTCTCHTFRETPGRKGKYTLIYGRGGWGGLLKWTIEDTVCSWNTCSSVHLLSCGVFIAAIHGGRGGGGEGSLHCYLNCIWLSYKMGFERSGRIGHHQIKCYVFTRLQRSAVEHIYIIWQRLEQWRTWSVVCGLE